MPKSKIYLPDVNIWLAFVDPVHIHHKAAEHWTDSLSAGQAAFCRVTQMGLLRLITDRRVMAGSPRTQLQAWQIYKELRRDERTFFLAEPDGLEARWSELTQKASPSHELWTDCYLQAFADK